MTRVLVFFPHNPFPPRSGAHRRCLEIIQGLHALGAEVSLVSSTHTSDTAWHEIDPATLNAAGISRLFIHQPSIWDRRYIKYTQKLDNTLRREPPLDSANYAPPGLVRWFGQLADQLRPQVIVINYAFWGRLVTPTLHARCTSVMDTLDLVSLYRPRFLVMERYLPAPPFSVQKTDPAFLREDFFDAFNFQIAPAEYQIYDRFRYTIAITPTDAELIERNTHHTRVLTLPMTQATVDPDNQYDGAALYTPGRNPFNVQGYLYFAARVLPRVLAQDPSFCLHVTGAVGEDLTPEPGIELRGFVPDLTSEYKHAPFLVCPILGKTGQQIKIVEAMAHGVPVIATSNAAAGSPICHGENGFVARDAEEFATYVLRLWQDRALCRKLGQAARAAISERYSEAVLERGLRQILPTAQA